MTRQEAGWECLHWAVIASATCVPWVLGAAFHWWIGMIALLLLYWAYDRLFIPPGALCMGMPFMLPFTSGMAYFGWGVILLLLWLLESAGFTVRLP